MAQVCSNPTPDTAATAVSRDLPPTAVPCPEWCDEPAGHPYDQLAGNPAINEARTHGHKFGDSDLSADVVFTAEWEDGRECAAFDPEIVVDVPGSVDSLRFTTPDQARRLAAYLGEAADLLERVRADCGLTAQRS